MRYIFGGGNYYIAIFPPICQGGKIYYIAIFPPIQVRGTNGYIAIFPGGGEWLYNTGLIKVMCFIVSANLIKIMCLLYLFFFHLSHFVFGLFNVHIYTNVSLHKKWQKKNSIYRHHPFNFFLFWGKQYFACMWKRISITWLNKCVISQTFALFYILVFSPRSID